MGVTIERQRRSGWIAVRPWLGTLVRLGLAAVWFFAGASKVGDLAASGRAVNAYRLMPFDVAEVIGAALPFVELALALLLLVGIATRLAAAASTVLLLVFIAGVSSVWTRRLSIDCGCFGGGGDLAAGQSPCYGTEIVRDVAFLVLAAFLIVYPRTRLSLDARLLRDDLEERGSEPDG